MTGDVGQVPRTRRGVQQSTVLAVAALGAFLAFVDATIVNVAFPDVRETFPDASIGTVSWIFNAYNVVFAAFLVAAGRLADLLGHRRLFIAGIAIFTAASALCGVAPALGVLIAARALQAVGAAILVPASLALVLAAFPAERRTHAVGLWGAAAALAAGLGPPLGGLIVELESWRSAFLVNVPVGIATIVLARRALVESRAPGRRTMPDLRGSALLAAGVAALTLAIVQGESWGWSSPRVLGCLLASGVLAAVVVRRVRRHPSPVVDPALLRVRAFGVANALTVLAGFGFYAYLLNHILFLTSVWGYTVLEAGLAVAPGALVAAVVAARAGAVADRRDARQVIVPGAVVWALAYVWYVAVVGPEPSFVLEWLPGQVLSGIGVGMTLPVLAAAAVSAVPGGRYAMASSIVSSTRQLGGVLGIAILVVVVGAPESRAAALDAFDAGWALSAACFALVAAGAPLLGRVRRDAAVAEPEAAAPVVEPMLATGGYLTPPVHAAELLDDDPVAILRRAPLLAGLDEELVRELAGAAQEVRLQAGEHLMRVGQAADAVYFVRSGRLEVSKGGEDEVIQVLGLGDVVGELGVLSGRPRSAAVRAARDAVLLRILREDLDRVLVRSPEAARVMLSELADRIQAMPVVAARSRPAMRVIAVVPLSRDVDVAPFATALEAQLRRFGTLQVLQEGDGAALEAAERRNERVVLEVLAHSSAGWRDFALRQADRVVAVAGPHAGPTIELLHPHLRGCELVFLGGRPERRPLLVWFDLLEPRHGSVVRTAPGAGGEDVARLARRLARRSVGLVLSGGGARALAHLGVLEVLEDCGVPIDRVGGVSMGSIVGGLVARGLPAASVDALIYEEFVRREPMSDYHLSSQSLLRGQRAAAMVTRLFGEEELIEELEREYFCVSVDLISRELVEHRRGRVREAVGASSVIPGLLPAVARQGRVLVDGGVLNNLPVDLMAARDDGPIIAVDVTQQFDAALEGSGRTRTEAAGFAPVGLRDAIVRSITLGSLDTSEAARRHADLVIRPDSGGAGIFEFHQIDALRDAGRRAALEALQAWTAPADAAAAGGVPATALTGSG